MAVKTLNAAFILVLLLCDADRTIAQVNIDDYAFTQIVDSAPCAARPKVSFCNNALNAANVTALKEGWASFGDTCTPEDHQEWWTIFWLHAIPDRAITNFFDSTFVSNIKPNMCSELVYQTCDETIRRCVCDLGAVYDQQTRACKLIEGANVRFSCGDNLIPNQMKPDSPAQLVTDPRSCLLDFRVECAGSSVCMCQLAEPNEDDERGFAVLRPVCNPLKGRYDNAAFLIDSTITKAVSLEWLRHGESCIIYENFSSKYISHIQVKELIIEWLQNFVRKFTRICNPFDNQECDEKSRRCVCAKDFVFQDGECRLIAIPADDNENDIISADGSTPLNASCEWVPQFSFFVGHNNDDFRRSNQTVASDFKDSNSEVFSELGVRTVTCVENAECVSQGAGGSKVCKCKPGMVCQSEPTENQIGPSQIVNKKLHAISLSSALAMLFLSANPR